VTISIPPFVFDLEDFWLVMSAAPMFLLIVPIMWFQHRKGGLIRGFGLSIALGALVSFLALSGLLLGVAWWKGAASNPLAYGHPEYWFAGGMSLWTIPVLIVLEITGVSKWMRKVAPKEEQEQPLWENGPPSYPKSPLTLSDVRADRK
jgi:hypothetical protein